MPILLSFVNTYCRYFEYIAKMHPSLRHRSEIGSKTFNVILQRDIKELDMARVDINAAAEFILLAIIPTDETVPTEDGNTMRVHTGGFFVFKKCAPRTERKNEWQNALYDCEVLAEHVLQRMVVDSQNGHPLFHRQADRYEYLNARKTERVLEEKWFGYLVTFQYKNILPDCPLLSCAWLDGGDGGRTPHLLV